MPMPLKRVVAVGGGAVAKGAGSKCAMVIMVTRGTVVERMEVFGIQPDGTDATGAIIGFMKSYEGEVDVLMAKSVPIAGFNYIDAKRVLAGCGVPSVFVLEEVPDMAAVRRALKGHFADWEARLQAIEGAGQLHCVEDGEEKIFIECVGIGLPDAVALVKGLTIFGRVPEPIRLACMAARAFSSACRGG